MKATSRRFLHLLLIGAALPVMVLAPTAPLCAQQGARSDEAHPAGSVAAPDDYRIGPGDVVAVGILDAPELGGRFRVSEQGDLDLPVLSKPIHAEGMTTTEISAAVRQAMIAAKQLRDPKVNTFVEEFHGRTVTVLGAVAKPSVYPLQRRTTVLEALSMAGGLALNAGNTVTVVRGEASAEAAQTTVGSVQIIDLGRLVKGKDPSANIEVRKGDVISVATGELVYVVGAVTKPGGFVMQDPSSGVSVAQAVALAEGFSRYAAASRGVIIRQSTSGTARQMVPVNISQVLSGKQADMTLAPNDILFVPESSGKKSLKVAGDVAMAAVNGLATYGLGYRIGINP